MIDLLNETPLSLGEACKAIPSLDGKRPHISTVFRWMTTGFRGVQLEHVRIGRRMCTTREALDRFFQRITEGIAGAPGKSQALQRTPKQRIRDLEKANATLARHGIKVSS